MRQAATGCPTDANVLFITVDDLNSFASPFGGYPGAITPNMERLARWGVAFQRAYCPVPHCGGSRSSTLTGVAAYRSKHYDNANILTEPYLSPALANLGISGFTTLPAYFKQRLGYTTMGGGKIFMGGFGYPPFDAASYDAAAWNEYHHLDFNAVRNTFPSAPDYGRGETNGQRDDRLPAQIGAAYNTPGQEALMPDTQLAAWGAQALQRFARTGERFFLSLGFFRPHFAWFVPQRYYDLFPPASIRVPNFFTEEDDLRDVPRFAQRFLVEMEWTAYNNQFPGSKTDHYELERMPRVDNLGGHAQAIRGYLASMAYCDECLGVVRDALEATGLRQNTIVVLWGDNGWNFGEKLGWRKDKLWEESTRVPLIISVPGWASGQNCTSVVSTLDLYPTLVDLVQGGQPPSLPGNHQVLDGRSLRPLLLDANHRWNGAAITSVGVDWTGSGQDEVSHTLRTKDWRYVLHPQDSLSGFAEELYNLTTDPNARNNLLFSAWDAHQPIRLLLRKLLTARVRIAEDLP